MSKINNKKTTGLTGTSSENVNVNRILRNYDRVIGLSKERKTKVYFKVWVELLKDGI